MDWKPSDSTLVYATYSEGFRPLVLNRDAGRPSANQVDSLFADYRIPILAVTDELENYEIGFKGDLFDDALRFNATLYRSEITDLQSSRFDPSNIGILVFVENVGDAEITGVDMDFQWVVSDNFSIFGVASFVDSEHPVLEAYTLVNFSIGLKKNDWGAEFYIDNVADERGQVHISSEDYAPSVSTSRPRTMGLRFSYDI